MRIVFMGTPDFALTSLCVLLDGPHDVVGVVTQPDRPQGRGLQLTAPPIKRVALENDISVFQPERLRDESFLAELRALQADLFVVVAFRILPASVLSVPLKGAVNLHASLLPKYRGAAPIQWAIINGETETGVTTFFIERQVDTGHILLQHTVSIGPDETAGELHDRLSEVGATLVQETVDLIDTNQAHPVPQCGVSSAAPKLTKADGKLDWTESAQAIHDRVRGLNPYPMAYTTREDRTLRVICSRLRPDIKAAEARTGEIVAVEHDGGIVVRTGAGCIALMTVQPEGRKRMSAGEFVRGYRIRPGERLGADKASSTAEKN